jgi:hypothetical protein
VHRIVVDKTREDAGRLTFAVRVLEDGGESRHEVTVARKDIDRLSAEHESPERFIARCFDFLLAREPKESILSRFDVSVIGRYFPEFEREIRLSPPERS